ncbi:MAG: L-threonylcarbamoyladenylate synthase [Actinomycetes bacterium]
MDDVERAVAALRAGEPVLLPTDGVYGLCADGDNEVAAHALYALKGRDATKPSALIAATIETLFDRLPELDPWSRAIVAAVLPGSYTLVLPNPAERYPWLNGPKTDAIAIRVASVSAATQRVLDAVGVVVATSANEPGEPAATSLDEVPARIRAGCGAEIESARLSGEASTVIDFTAADPIVLREGAGSSAAAIARAAGALAELPPR